MNYSPAWVVKKFLVDNGIGALASTKNADWYIFVDELPVDKDQAIAVYNTRGTGDGRILRTTSPYPGSMIRHPGIQIRVRAVDPDTAYDKIAVMAKPEGLLDSINKAIVTMPDLSKYILKAFHRVTEIVSLGEEEMKRRVSYVVNGLVTISEG